MPKIITIGNGLFKEAREITLYTTKEVSEITDITIPTLYKHIKAGTLKGRKHHKDWLFTAEEIEAFVLRHTEPGSGKGK